MMYISNKDKWRRWQTFLLDLRVDTQTASRWRLRLYHQFDMPQLTASLYSTNHHNTAWQ